MNSAPLSNVDEDAVIESALAHEKRLAAEAQFEMLRAGVRNTAAELQKPDAQENLSRGALGRALLDHLAPNKPQPKGPSRRSKPKVDARKRQRQARKKNRRR